MHWGVVGSNLRVWFAVDDGKGIPREGISTGDFDVTVVDEGDSDSTSPTVSESSQQAGLYQFDVPGTFLTTYGAGEYGVLIKLSTTSPKLNAVKSVGVKVTQEDIDTLSIISSDTSLLRKAVTNRQEESPGTPGLLTLYDDDGSTKILEQELRDNFDGGIDPATSVPAKRSANILP